MSSNITLVLSGGGARGIAHIGVIEEIESRGYQIRSIAGTSMGALVGGVYATGKLEEFKEWLYSLDRRKIFLLLDFAFSSQGLIKGDRILGTIKKFVSNAKIEDLDIVYTATAFDLAHHKEVVFSSGNLYDAIRASISIPTVFTPVVYGDSIFVDGGVINNIPINNAVRTENDHLVAVNVNAEMPVEMPRLHINYGNERRPILLNRFSRHRQRMSQDGYEMRSDKLNYFKLIDHTIASATNQLSQMAIQRYNPEILIEISRRSAGTFEFKKVQELIETGRLAARKKLDVITQNEKLRANYLA